MTQSTTWDAIIVGAGPAGLSAALYLARFRRKVLVVHDGTARALRIPNTHNAPGFPDGISGPDLVERMMRHAVEYGAESVEARAVSAETLNDGFAICAESGDRWQARSLILATGLYLNQIALPTADHEAAIAAGVLRYCPVCDGYEHIDKRIAVVGCDEQGAAEALFLRQFSADVTLLPKSHAELDEESRTSLSAAGVTVIELPIRAYRPQEQAFAIDLEDGARLTFDIVYPALGVRPRTRLAEMLGLQLDEKGRVSANACFETSVPGIWCAGDIVDGLDQISVAMGHGAVAATRLHNWLRALDGHVLP